MKYSRAGALLLLLMLMFTCFIYAGHTDVGNEWLVFAGIFTTAVALCATYTVLPIKHVGAGWRREPALEKSELMLQSIIEAFPVPAFVIGMDHRVIHWNKALEAISGVRADAVIGTAEHYRAFYREERPCLADIVVDGHSGMLDLWYSQHYMKSTLSEDAYEATVFLPDLGGDGKWLHLKVAAVKDSRGHVVGAIETLEDITERKRSDDVLKKAFADLRQLDFIVNKGPAVAFLWRAAENWPVEYVSDNVVQFGYTPDDLTGGGILYTQIVHPDDLARVAAEVAQYSREATVSEFRQEYRIVCKSGEVRWVDDRTGIRRDAAGRVTHYQGIVFDITDRKQAEEALISANRELNDIVEFFPDATVVIDKDGKVVAWNRAMEEMTGIPKKDVIGKQSSVCAILFYGELRPCLLDLLDGCGNDFESLYGDIERKGEVLLAKTYVPGVHGGRGAFVFATAAPLRDIHGRRVGAIECIRDITESKKKEEALLESQQQLADIINFLPDATLVIDKEGRVISWNLAMEEMTGIRAADMLGKGEFEYALPFYGDRRPILIDLVLRPQEEVEAEYDYVERKKTSIAGEAYMPSLKEGGAYLLGKASALFDRKGNIVGAIESIRDISERRRTEEALLRAEEKYRSIFENAMEGIYQTTLGGQFISVNPAFAHMLGYDSPDEVLSEITDISQQVYVNPEDRAELLGLLSEQGMVLKFETQFFRKDEKIAWVTLNIRAARDKSGEISYLEGTADDISDRKALEAKLVQVQKMEAIGTLAGGIAHDFNNILAPIIGYSELALQEIPPGSRLFGNIEQVLRSGRRAKDLVRQILTFSRKTEQECRPVQVSRLINETRQMLRSMLPSTIEISQRIDEDVRYSTIIADPTQVHQVLMNLCTNAAHAMRERGGTLSISLDRLDIGPHSGVEIQGMGEGPCLRLSVSDTGQGMDEEVKQRIFDPYFTTKGPDEGTGLGLAVVYGIVEGLSGGIIFDSTPGEGTTFQVLFPLTEAREAALPVATGSLPTGKGRVLVVDDEKYIGEMLKEMLEQLGYEVVLKNGSIEALSVFRAQASRFDIVITDQTMPHMTGADLARELLKIRPGIPIILCTGFSAIIDEAGAKEIGISALLMKPLSLRHLAEQVRSLLADR